MIIIRKVINILEFNTFSRKITQKIHKEKRKWNLTSLKRNQMKLLCGGFTRTSENVLICREVGGKLTRCFDSY